MSDAPHTPEPTPGPTPEPAPGPTPGPTSAPSTEAPGPDEPVPRLPRGRGIRVSRPELLRIAGLAILLVFLVVAQRPCADAVSRFVTSFGDAGSASAPLPRSGTVDIPTGSSDSDLGRYEQLRPGMTEAEIKAAIERARARARAQTGSGESSSATAPAPAPAPASSPPAPPSR